MDLNHAQQTEKDCMIGLYPPIRFPMVIARGEGCRVWDTEGHEYLDLLSGGRAVNILGHCHPKVVEAICIQAGVLMHTSNDFYTEPALELAKLLHDLSDGMRAFFCNSGAEANEAAIKLARKHAIMHGDESKVGIVTTFNSFHGRTFASLSATGQPKYQKGFGPMLPGFTHVPYNDLSAMEAAVSDTTAAVILEPIQGESGVYPATQEYLKGVEALCRTHNALLVLDEIQTGMGRTGTFFAYEQYGVTPDVVTLAKGIAGGVPMGAMLAREPAASSLAFPDHATTFGGSALPAAAAVATIKTIIEDGLLDYAKTMGEYLVQKLCALQQSQPLIKEIRGRGLMVGVDLTQPVAPAVKKTCCERGVLLLTVGDSILRLLPAMSVTREQIDTGITVIEETLAAV